jgi:hypothetical protein
MCRATAKSSARKRFPHPSGQGLQMSGRRTLTMWKSIMCCITSGFLNLLPHPSHKHCINLGRRFPPPLSCSACADLIWFIQAFITNSVRQPCQRQRTLSGCGTGGEVIVVVEGSPGALSSISSSLVSSPRSRNSSRGRSLLDGWVEASSA